MLLEEYIVRNKATYPFKQDFAKAYGITPTTLGNWFRDGYIVEDGMIWSPHRKLMKLKKIKVTKKKSKKPKKMTKKIEISRGHHFK